MSLILVTHDVGTVSDKVTHVACLNQTLHFHGDAETFDSMDDQALSQFYGHDIQVIHHDHHHHGDMNNAISIFHYEFLQNAFIAGMLIGFIAPLLGVFIVVRRLSHRRCA